MPEARFLAALAGDKADGLFFAGDLGQRIFQQPFSSGLWRFWMDGGHALARMAAPSLFAL
jgi:hypothetical protein